jgi:peptidyl-prolyl cis-trans isomerase C
MRKLVFFLAAGLLAPGAAALAQEAADDPVVATVNGEELRRSDLEAAAASLPEQYRQMPLPMIYDLLLDRVIDFELLANEAERLELGDEPEVQPALERARADVLRNALVQQRVLESTSEERLRERYEQLKQSDDFMREEVHARHILLESEEEAQAVIEELQGGADFAALAGERSTDPSAARNAGDLGFFAREQMVDEFAEAAFALEPGEVSPEPVQSQFGWHVIEVLDRRSVEPSFAETEPQLRQELAREAITSLLAGLREDAEIERFALDGSPQEPAAGSPGDEPEDEPPAQQ